MLRRWPRSSSRRFLRVAMQQPCSAWRLSKKINRLLCHQCMCSSVRWYKEIEMKKGAGVAQGGGGFQDWFHGVITRKQAEVRSMPLPHLCLLSHIHRVFSANPSQALSWSASARAASDTPSPTCMAEVQVSLFFFEVCIRSVSPGKIKHYMVEQTINNEYQVVGNPKTFRLWLTLSLSTLI